MAYPTVLFVPDFVVKTLNRNKIPLTTLCDLRNNNAGLSINYMAYVLYLNNKITNLLKIQWERAVREGMNTLPAEQNTEQEKNYNVAQVLADDKSTQSELDKMLATTAQYDDTETYITYDTGSNIVCVSIKEGFDYTNSNTLFNLTKDILKLWYVYEEQEAVAKTQLFKKYLELLAKN